MENQPLTPGDAAPDFELLDDGKKKIKLSDLRGKKVVLLFYPMDFSPVCTAEHCAFGPELPTLQADDDTVIFGVSCDTPYTHAAYRKQYQIPYALLADPTRKMAKAYGMWGGEEPYNATKRGTVVIGKDGTIKYYEVVPNLEARTVDRLVAVIAGE